MSQVIPAVTTIKYLKLDVVRNMTRGLIAMKLLSVSCICIISPLLIATIHFMYLSQKYLSFQTNISYSKFSNIHNPCYFSSITKNRNEISIIVNKLL